MSTRKAALRVVSICVRAALFALVILGIIWIGQETFRCTRAVFGDTAMEEAPGRTVKIRISEEITTKKFAEFLERKGVIEDEVIFRIQMKYHRFEKNIKPGVYELNTSMPPSEIIRVMSDKQEEDDT